MRLRDVTRAGAVWLLAGQVCLAGLPALTKAEVIQIADDFAVNQGVCLKCYQRPVISHHNDKSGNYWTAYYVPRPHRDSVVAVDSPVSIHVDAASHLASNYPVR